MNKLLIILALAILSVTGRAYERLQGPTELLYWNKTQTDDGYTFFGAQGTTYLIDMEGRVVHTWPVGTNPRLLDNGHVLDATNSTTFVELDWNGSNVWSYTESRTGYFPHGDFLRIYNPKLGTNTTLYIANKTIISNQCISAGCNPANGAYTDVTVDAIVEVNSTGTVVWEWCFFDHGVQDYSASKSNYVSSISNAVGRINLNLPGRPLTNDWLHCVSLDYNQTLDQIVITAEGGEFYVIDHGNTFSAGNPATSIALAASTTGDFLYRFGDPARYSQGNPPSITLNWTKSTTGNKQIGGVSQTTWIPAGVPGAGHFLVFNNGQDLFETTPQSYLFEVNGYRNAATNDTGAYVNPPSAGYNTWSPPGHDTDKEKKNISRQVVSIFMSMANQAFFSPSGGSAQRLPNSNTLVCAASAGHIFEVTPATNVVWEYICPVTTNGVVAYKRDDWPLSNPVYRATRYSTTYAAFAGHTLAGSNTIAGSMPSYISAPNISGTTQNPVSPYSTNTVSVSATITNNRVVTSATLTYIVGTSTNAVAMTNTDTVYSATIPAYTAGALVRYFLSAADDFGNTGTGTLYSYTVQAGATNFPPVISNVTQSPTSPASTDPVTITALVTDDTGLASVTLTYSTGSSGGVTNKVFSETMATVTNKPWTGSFCDNLWTVTGNYFEQRIGSNQGSGNPCGMEYKAGATTNALTNAMVATANSINAVGSSGAVEFWIQTLTLDGADGWTFQLDSGSGYVTRLSELTGSSHSWQKYHYDLTSSELVNSLKMRFQFTGGGIGDDDRIDLDQISLWVTTTGASYSNVTMLLVSNGLYTAQIPAQSLGTTVAYYVTAQDSSGQTTTGTTTNYNTTGGGWSMVDLPDTGQILSYTGTFGEDSDFAIHPPAYANNGDGSITDLVTGLIWQQTDGGEMTWENAAIYATTNRVAGYSDWRLPTAHELYSISKQGAVNPAINTNYFTGTLAEYWWTRDQQVGNTNIIWVANAGGGIGNHPKTETISAGGSKRFHVRCVRGAPAPSSSSPIHHFTNNGNGTVTDLDTGLMWQQAEISTTTNWASALAYADGLALGGNTDWRVPNIKELQSINDETLASPSVSTGYFPGATAAKYWSSTSLHNSTNEAWYLDCQYGITTYTNKTSSLLLRCVRGGTTNITNSFTAQFVRIPGGSYVMGDHFGFVDPEHPNDELPLHNVYISPLYMATTLATVREYCDYLNAAQYQGLIEVRSNIVYAIGGTNEYFYTYDASVYSRIQYTNDTFVVLNNRDLHPLTSVRWFGAIAYCNWLSQRGEFKPCYNLDTGDVDFTKNGFRLPTEAEWEYAGRGGLTNPYCMFPWGTNSNANGTYANWEGSGDPFETGSYPYTTPVGFYNGALRSKSDYNWPGSQTTYQTSDGSNPFGLYDMAGNVWEWVNDWYASDYYTNCVINGIVTNPPGPVTGTLFTDHDNIAWRNLRGGTWYNGGGQTNFGFSRVSNRDPSWSRGPATDGNNTSTWFQVGFRVMRPDKAATTVGLFLNTSSAYPGYTLMSPMHSTNTYLINNAGQYVHKWTNTGEPGRSSYLTENGHLFRSCAVTSGGPSTGGGEGGRIEEKDWLGNLVWAIDYVSTNYIQHHDFRVLPSGNILLLVAEKKLYAEVVAAGFNTSQLDSSIATQGYMLPDCLIEVQPTRPYGGTVVWEWHMWDHMIQDYSSSKSNYYGGGGVALHPELIDANGTGQMIQQFWNHVNGIDYNAQLDQIMLSVRNNSELFVIDHSATMAQAAGHSGGNQGKGGDILYRWGYAAQYDRGASSPQQLFQQHHTHWISTNCPGAGNILIFNNGIGRGYSSVNEIVPPVNNAGSYSISAGAAFGPSTSRWTYVASPATNFYSAEISGADRLPNGNTLICEGVKGNLFEVNTNGVTVWQYICPETTAPLAQGSAIPEDTGHAGQSMNAVFRVTRYPTNYAGFVGKDLTPRGTIETYTGAATDTTGLGLPDIWVRAHFGSLSSVTATSDHDGDGLSDILEYQYGTDPIQWTDTNTWSDITALIASFSAGPTNGVASLIVTFTDTSTGTITNRFWSFGDGGTTNTVATNVIYPYVTTGTNTVTLIVSGPTGGSANTQSNLIVVTAYPTGDVNGDRHVTSADSLLINQELVGVRSSNSTVFATTGFQNADVNQNGVVSGADSLLVNQVIVGLRTYVVTKIVPKVRTNTVPTAVTIYGIGFPTNTVTGAMIGPPVNLTLSNIVVISREQINAVIPAGGGIGTGTVSVTATPSNGVISFGQFINQ